MSIARVHASLLMFYETNFNTNYQSTEPVNFPEQDQEFNIYREVVDQTFF